MQGGKRRSVDSIKQEALDVDVGSETSQATAPGLVTAAQLVSATHSFSSLGGAIQLQRSTSLRSEASHEEPVAVSAYSPHSSLWVETSKPSALPMSMGSQQHPETSCK